MKKKNILVCGASGFIGRNVFESLSTNKKYRVYGTYNSRKFSQSTSLIQADLTKRDDVEKVLRGIDIVIQAAATTSGAKDIVNRPYYHVTDNVIMNSLIFQSAFEQKVPHVVFFSCSVMYPTVDRPVKETDVDLNTGMHEKYFGVGWTKVYIEKLCEFYSRLKRTQFTVIRHSNIYGPYDKFDLERSHVFGATITKVLTTKDNTITIWGEGKEERDLLYVSDLVRFVDISLEKQNSPFELVNVGLGKSTSVQDLVKKIIQVSGKKLKIVHDLSKPSIPTKLVLDITKAKNVFGWEPKVSLEEGIGKTIEWYKKSKL